MIKPCLAWFAFALTANGCAAADYLPAANYFGAFTTESQDGSAGCASMDVKQFASGTPVHIVVLSQPQRILRGTVAARSSAECTRYFQGSVSPAFYDIRITQGKFQPHELGIVVLPGVALTQSKEGGAVATLGGQRYRFFECSSNEGIHVAVRSESKDPQLIWHDYLHLGIDVDPTCLPKDYAAMERLGKATSQR